MPIIDQEEYISGAPGAYKKILPVKVEIIEDKPVVFHKVGLAEIYIAPEEISYRTNMAFKGSKSVINAVGSRLEKLGLGCEIKEKEGFVTCKGKFEKPTDARTLAIFFRLLLDADISMGSDKPEAAGKIDNEAWEKAEEITKDKTKDLKDIPKITWNEILK